MKHVTELLQPFVSGELDVAREAAVEGHLKECSACRTEAERARRLWEALGALAASPAADSVWPAVRERTLGRGRAEREWFFGAGRMTRGALACLAVAAGLSLGVFLPAQRSGDAAEADNAVSWLSDATWLSQSSWLGGGDSPGIDDLLLGVELRDEENGS